MMASKKDHDRPKVHDWKTSKIQGFSQTVGPSAQKKNPQDIHTRTQFFQSMRRSTATDSQTVTGAVWGGAIPKHTSATHAPSSSVDDLRETGDMPSTKSTTKETGKEEELCDLTIQCQYRIKAFTDPCNHMSSMSHKCNINTYMKWRFVQCSEQGTVRLSTGDFCLHSDSTLELMQPVNNKRHAGILAEKFIDQIVDAYFKNVVVNNYTEYESDLVNNMNRCPGLYAEIINRVLCVAYLSSQQAEITKKILDFMKETSHDKRKVRKKIKVPYDLLNLFQDEFFFDKVRNKLSYEFPNCELSVENGHIYVIGCGDTYLVRAADYLSGLFKTEKITDLPEMLSEDNMKCHLLKKFGDCVVVEVDQYCQIQVSGLCEDVDKVLNENVDIKEGRVSLEKSLPHTKVSPGSPSSILHTYPIKDVRVVQFLTKSKYLMDLNQRFNCTATLKPRDFVVEIIGTEDNVNKAEHDIEAIVIYREDIEAEKAHVQCSLQFIHLLEEKHDVRIEKCCRDIITNGNITIEKKYDHERIVWNNRITKRDQSRKLIVQEDDGITNCGDVTFQFVNSRPGTSTRFSRQGSFVTVTVPVADNLADTELFTHVVTRSLEKLADGNEKSAVIYVQPVDGWSFNKFMKCIVIECTKWLVLSSTIYPYEVTMLVSSSDRKERTINLTDTYILQYINTNDEKPLVKVVEGQLDQMKADVLVNTAAWNLDLNLGIVSKALSNAAGPNLQKECFDKFPNGIRYGEVVSTSGYNLQCNWVFHVTVPKYSNNTSDHPMNIQNIRDPMATCLMLASKKNFQTIAFPAIGTGKLGYPIDIVASEMFHSVSRFRQDCPKTSLQEVMFVIYKRDTELLTIFRDMEKSFDQKFVASWKHCMWLEITGLPENVTSAKCSIKEKMHIASNPNAEIEEFIGDISLSQCTVIYEMFYHEMNKMGKCIRYDKQKQGFTIKGKVGIVGPYATMVKDYIEIIKSMRQHKLSVHCKNFKELHSKVKIKFGDEVFMTYDADECLMEIYTRKKETLDAVVKNIQIRLKQQNDESEISKKKKVEQPEEKMTDKIQRKLPERSFSWSKDVSDMKVFQTKCLVVKVYNTDILRVPVEVIVNAANATLDHCGGVARKIAKGAGEDLVEESKQIMKEHQELPVSSVVYTTAGCLQYKCILHAVGPSWSDYEPITMKSLKKCEDDLSKTITNCLMVANRRRFTTMALPTISSGLFKVPHEICAEQYAHAILNYTKTDSLKEVHFVNNDLKSDIIPIIHKVFSEMIINKRKSPFPKDLYLQSPVASAKQPDVGAYNVNEKQKMKNPGRSKPASATDCKPVIGSNRFSAQDFSINVHYEKKGDRLIFAAREACPMFVYIGDIFSIDGIDAVVCSDNKKGEGKGMIAKRLCSLGGKKFCETKAHEFKSPQRFSEVVTTCGGGKINYKSVLTVVISRNSVGKLDEVYRNVFEEARQQKIQSLVLPLLGTGTCDFSAKDSAEILWLEWIQFCGRYRNDLNPLQVHLVLLDKNAFIEVQKLFLKFIGIIEKHNKSPGARNIKIEESHDVQKKLNDQNDDNNEDNDSKTDQAMSTRNVEENCVICMDKIDNPKKLKCGHSFCTDCIDGYFKVKQMCPTCGQVFGVIFGDQPDGTMMICKRKSNLAGYENYGCFALTYDFPASSQGPNHPQPGILYKAVRRTGYLPDTKRGRTICAMMKVAFDRRLVFTIGTSRTTGEQGVITWNDIHHKTDNKPNTQFGYPDSTYLDRVTDELAAKGVTLDDVNKGFLKKLKSEQFKDTFYATKL